MRRNTLRELRAYLRRVGPLIHALNEAVNPLFRLLMAYEEREKGERLSREDRRLLETGQALLARQKAVYHHVLLQVGRVKCPPIAATYHWLIQDAWSDHCKWVDLLERVFREGSQSQADEADRVIGLASIKMEKAADTLEAFVEEAGFPPL